MLFVLLLTLVPIQSVRAEKITREKLNDIKDQKKGMLDLISTKDAAMKKEVEKMNAADAKIKQTEIEAAKVEIKLYQAEKELKVYDDKFKKRIRNLYQKGEMGYMATLFAADSFGKFLHRYEIVRVIMKKDYSLIQDRKEAKSIVEKELAAFDKLRKLQNLEVQKSQKAYKKIVEAQKKNKKKLGEIQEIIEDHQDEIISINLAELRSGSLKFPYQGPLKRPSNIRQTSAYGYRTHPIFGTQKLHAGIDYGGPVGTPIYAAGNGVVVETRPAGGYGWLITIYHGTQDGKRIYTRYAHSYPDQVKVKAGQEVIAGEHITSVGNNGNSTGPHLHFEVRVGNGDKPPPDNPENYF